MYPCEPLPRSHATQHLFQEATDIEYIPSGSNEPTTLTTSCSYTGEEMVTDDEVSELCIIIMCDRHVITWTKNTS
jgi:hypothetical protein